MPEVRIEAEPRTEFGKGAARAYPPRGSCARRYVRARRGEPPLLAAGARADARAEDAERADPAGGRGRAALALPKAVQRHAIKGLIEHVDLIEVRSGEKVTVEIPIRVTGDVFSGGMLDQQLVQLSVEAEATHLPDGVSVDVEGAEIGTRCSPRTSFCRRAPPSRATRMRWSCTWSRSRPPGLVRRGDRRARRGRGPAEVPPAPGAAEAE